MGQLPPFFSDRARRQRQNARSAAQEKAHAEKTGGKRQMGSGSSWKAREDVRGPVDDDGEGYLDQHKGTRKRRACFELDDWKETQRNAIQLGRDARWVFEFEDGTKLYLVEADE